MIIQSEIHFENWKKSKSFQVTIAESKTLVLMYPQTLFNQNRKADIFQLNILPSEFCDGRLLCRNHSRCPGNQWEVPVVRRAWDHVRVDESGAVTAVFALAAQIF